MHFRVRRAAPADAPAAAAFGRAAFSAAFGFLYAPEALARYLDAVYAPAAVAAWLRNPRMLLVLAEEAVGEADAGAVADAGAEADAPAAHTMTAAPPMETRMPTTLMAVARSEAPSPSPMERHAQTRPQNRPSIVGNAETPAATSHTPCTVFDHKM